MRAPISHRRVLAATALALCAVLTACGGEDSDADEQTTSSAVEGAEDAGGDGEIPTAPEECAEPFPLAFGGGDLDSLTLKPADWPEPFSDPVLCGTSATLDESQQEADFAVDADEAEVLSTFESALSALDGYQVSREDPSGLGRQMLSGSAGDVYFQVVAVDGGYTVAFAGESA